MARKLWQLAEWKKQRSAFIVGKSCDWNPLHSGPLTLDHLSYLNSDGALMTNDQLMDFEKLYRESKLMVLCRRCAQARRYNKIICERCGENYHGYGMEVCFECKVKNNPEDYTLCSNCGENYHHKKYTRCYMCNKGARRSRSSLKGWQTRRSKGRKI